MTRYTRPLLVAVGLAAQVACAPSSAIGTPDFPRIMGGVIVGTGPRDIWWWAPNTPTDASATAYQDTLWHYGGGGWNPVEVPAAVMSDPTTNRMPSVAAAGEGELWMAQRGADGTVAVLRVDTSGAVLADHTGELPALPAGQLVAAGNSRGLFVSEYDPNTSTATWFRYDGTSFVPLAPPPGQVQLVAVVGEDDAYFNLGGAVYEYAEGTWTATDPGRDGTGLVVLPTPSGDAWLVLPFGADTVWHRSGDAWSPIQVSGYTQATTDRSPTLTPVGWALGRDGNLALLSRWNEPASGGFDWSEQAYVGGSVGVDGAYRQTDIVVPAENCDPTCYNTLSYFDGFGPARLDDGSIVLNQYGEPADDGTQPDWTAVVWTP